MARGASAKLFEQILGHVLDRQAHGHGNRPEGNGAMMDLKWNQRRGEGRTVDGCRFTPCATIPPVPHTLAEPSRPRAPRPYPRTGGPISTLRFLPVLALLLLVACGSSSTDPGAGSGEFELTTAFDEGDAEFEEDAAGTRVRFDDIDFGGRTSSTLSPDDRLILNGFAAVFEALPTAGYAFESHTDGRGATSENLDLTRRRANAVRDYLIQVVEGPGPYITARGLGEDVPLADGTSQADFARNDRIEIGVRNAQGYFVMDEVVREQVQANDGESFDLDFVARAPIRAVETDVVEIHVVVEEFDGGDFFDFRRTARFDLAYSAALDCWGPAGGDACGVVESGVVTFENTSSSRPPCAGALAWSLRLEEVR
jgi:outer membrane protein OmpA-like peptidoglycan-associated protein